MFILLRIMRKDHAILSNIEFMSQEGFFQLEGWQPPVQSKQKIDLSELQHVLEEESRAIYYLCEHLDENFEKALELILSCKGRLITCGIGKSGHIARKAAGTFSSTGTPSFFIHAAEAVHGDLGMITSQDVVLLLSYSGETEELLRLFPSIQSIGAQTILVTGRPKSSAGKLFEVVLDIKVSKEVCPHNLAPTTSTTVMLALCDALALAVMKNRGFSEKDFARFHPNGALGRRLLLKVKDVMRQGEDLPLVHLDDTVLQILRSITNAGAGAACVVDQGKKLVGFISEGDLRRHFISAKEPMQTKASQIMNKDMTVFPPEMLAAEALESFQNLLKKIGEVPVVDEKNQILGLLVLKDLLRCGIV